MGVFDAMVITNDGVDVIATVARRFGPLERGGFDPATGSWVPAADPTLVDAPGFGIDGSGRPYFDTDHPSDGEAARLFVDAESNTIWLEAD